MCLLLWTKTKQTLWPTQYKITKGKDIAVRKQRSARNPTFRIPLRRKQQYKLRKQNEIEKEKRI